MDVCRFVFRTIGATAVLGVLFSIGPVRADIFQWEYVNPADISQGKQRSNTLCVDGAGIAAAPGANLYGLDLSMADLSRADLRFASIRQARLLNADLSGANLGNAYFSYLSLQDVDFTDAIIQRAWFYNVRDFSPSQLYSTASYQAHDLEGVHFSFDDLTEWNFAGQNLAKAELNGANLTRADFRDANLSNAHLDSVMLLGASLAGANVKGAVIGAFDFSPSQLYATASYQNNDLTGIRLLYADLSDWSFANQNLTNAYFSGNGLSGVDFTDAQIQGTRFEGVRNFTSSQLYSTASYQAGELSGIVIDAMDVIGWDFTAQNLSNCVFDRSNASGANFSFANLSNAVLSADLSDVDFKGANLTNANFSRSTLSGADFAGADARGSEEIHSSRPVIDAPNFIQPGGYIARLDLTSGASLTVRDYDGNPAVFPVVNPMPITIESNFVADASGKLLLEFDADSWDSTIVFRQDMPVHLVGTLVLAFAKGVDPGDQIGRTMQVFDWSHVTHVGQFQVSSQYVWDLSELYTTGNVKLVAVPESGSIAWAAIVIALRFIAGAPGSPLRLLGRRSRKTPVEPRPLD